MPTIQHKGIALDDIFPFIKEEAIGKIKRGLALAWREFVFGGHLLSLGASGILLSVSILAEKPPSIVLLLAGYALSQIVYSFDHYKDIKEDAISNPARVQHLVKQKSYFFTAFAVYWLLLLASLFYLNNIKVAGIIGFILLGGLLSSIFAKKITRYIVGFKSIYVSFFWALLSVVAIFFHQIASSGLLILLFLFIFFRFLVSTIFFDIKDIASDKTAMLKTLPIVLRKNKTLYFLHIFNLFSFLPIIVGIIMKILPPFSFMLLILAPFTYFYLKKSIQPNVNIQNLSYIVVDGEYIIWPIVVLISKFLFQ